MSATHDDGLGERFTALHAAAHVALRMLDSVSAEHWANGNHPPDHRGGMDEGEVQASLAIRNLKEALFGSAASVPASVPAVPWLGRDPVRDWPDDVALENGQYSQRCRDCGHEFTGHKLRRACRLCAKPNPAPTVGLAPVLLQLTEVQDALANTYTPAAALALLNDRIAPRIRDALLQRKMAAAPHEVVAAVHRERALAQVSLTAIENAPHYSLADAAPYHTKIARLDAWLASAATAFEAGPPA